MTPRRITVGIWRKRNSWRRLVHALLRTKWREWSNKSKGKGPLREESRGSVWITLTIKRLRCRRTEVQAWRNRPLHRISGKIKWELRGHLRMKRKVSMDKWKWFRHGNKGKKDWKESKLCRDFIRIRAEKMKRRKRNHKWLRGILWVSPKVTTQTN